MNASLCLAALVAAVLAAAPAAQHTVLFTINESGGIPVLSASSALPAAGELTDDEIGIVTPLPGQLYSAEPFLNYSTQWAFLGDHDGDGDFFESGNSSPGGSVDAIFVHPLRRPGGTYTARDVFLSKSGDLPPLWLEADVFRYSAQGAIETFLHEADLLVAIGQAPGSSIDLNAICMDSSGNLFLSFNTTEMVNGVAAEDGAIVYIPASAITLDANFDVTALAPGSAMVVASEADVTGWIMQSGVRDASGQLPSLSVDVSALEIDPRGGTFTSPQMPSLTLPDLLFSWDGSDCDGAVFTTASGGSIAVVNGAPLGSQVATVGIQLGLLPGTSGTAGVFGLGLIPLQLTAPFAVESYPAVSYGLTTPLFAQQDVTGATPSGQVVFFLDTPVGNVHPAITVPGFGGAIYGSGLALVIGSAAANGNGDAFNRLSIPASAIGSGVAVAWQALDVTALRFADPAASDF